MAEIVKIWTFNSTLEDWVLSNTGDLTMSRITDDGDPDPGCLQGLILGRNDDGTGQAQWSGNYIDLGVPADAEVNGVSLKLRRKVEHWDTANHGHWKVESTPGTLVNQQNESGLAAWAEITGNTITGLTLAPNTALTVTLSCDLDVGNSKTAGIDFRWDTIELTVDYTPAFEAPQITTNNETDLLSSTVTLNGNLTSLGDAATVDVYFEWKEVGAPTWNTTTKQAVSATGPFNADLAELSKETSYEFRACGDYIAETDTLVVTGETNTFLTAGFDPPVVITIPATLIGYYEATINGEVTSMGEVPSVTVSFEYRRADSGDVWDSTPPETISTIGTFSEVLLGLTTNTAYEFRVVATYYEGDILQTIYGDILVFTTDLIYFTLSIDKVGNGSIKLNGVTLTLPYSELIGSDTYTLEAVPDPYNDFTEWIINGVPIVTNPTSIDLTEDKTVTAYFEGQNKIIIKKRKGTEKFALVAELPNTATEYKDSTPFSFKNIMYTYGVVKVINGTRIPVTVTAELVLIDAPTSVLLRWSDS